MERDTFPRYKLIIPLRAPFPIYEKYPDRDHRKAYHQRVGKFLIEEDGTEHYSEDGGEKGKGGESAH
jgi:hypothetical protein